MPIYSYQCEHCDIIEDKLSKIEDRVDSYVDDCCICGEKGVKFTRITPRSGGFRIKGKGVYKETSTFD